MVRDKPVGLIDLAERPDRDEAPAAVAGLEDRAERRRLISHAPEWRRPRHRDLELDRGFHLTNLRRAERRVGRLEPRFRATKSLEQRLQILAVLRQLRVVQ